MTIGPDTVVVHTRDLLSIPVDAEIVILNPERDNDVGLDAVGRAAWDHIEQPFGVAELCRPLSDDVDARLERIAHDILGFLTEMADEGLVRVVVA